jgi:hypothetical protein
MQTRSPAERWAGLTVLGILLLVVGLGWIVLRELQFDPFEVIADAGWPFFVIIPGIALLALSLIQPPPRGVAFAVAGTIVTAVGCVLLYQQSTGHWESWAYAWALVGPGAAGLGLLVYGLIFRQHDLVPVGAWMIVVAGAIFVIGYWFFETVFAIGHAPVDLGGWWPVALIGVGLAALIVGLLERNLAGRRSASPRAAQGDNR